MYLEALQRLAEKVTKRKRECKSKCSGQDIKSSPAVDKWLQRRLLFECLGTLATH